MNSLFDSSLWLELIVLTVIFNFVLHHVQERLDRLKVLFVTLDDRVQLRGFDLLVGRHVIVDLLVCNVPHLIVALLTNGQQSLRFMRVVHEI